MSGHRWEYTRGGLHEREVDSDPFRQFARWMREATDVEGDAATAMTLATSDGAGRPSARTVLLKDHGEEGFVFFTDARSRKAGELIGREACLLFFWPALERQVRITGSVDQVPAEVAAAYFETRPRGSQLGAWASVQSTTLPGGRDQLEQQLEEVRLRFAEGAVGCPPHWVGYRVQGGEFEFWQGRQDRLHDRLRYRRDGDRWVIERLSP